jgi:YesN/AraC family two-component response regulator
MLPSVTGFDVLRELGSTRTMPILMLTARGDDVDRIVGLELGADDYLSKPFNPRELVARMRAILRRASNRALRAAQRPTRFEIGPIVLNTGMHQVRVAGEPVPLTGAEFRVLELLMRSAGQVISRESADRTGARPQARALRSQHRHAHQQPAPQIGARGGQESGNQERPRLRVHADLGRCIACSSGSSCCSGWRWR